MKKVLLLLCALSGFATPAFSQSWCATPFTPSKLPASAYTNTNRVARPNGTTANTTCYYVRVFFHLVRNSNGSGGQPTSVIAQEMNFLTATYASHQIYFVNAGSDEILNTNFQNDIDQNKYNAIVNTQVASNALNVYLLDNSSNFNQGLANDRAVVIGGSVVGQNLTPSAVVAHELGHCLGLYHTFEYRMGDELVDGSNCLTAGDLVCDTPAESRAYNFTENSSCVYTAGYQDANGQTYNPDLRNVMDYMRPSCLEHFTDGQSDRMKATIANSSVLVPFISTTPNTPVVQGSMQICPSSSATYSVANAAGSIQWTSSNTNVATINASSGVATAVGQGNVTFSAVVTDACNVASSPGSVSVTVGLPGVIATYECSSGCNYPTPRGTLSGNDLVPAGTYTIILSPQGYPSSSVSSWSWSVTTDGSYYTYGTNNNTGIFTLGRGRRAYITVSGLVAGCGTASRSYLLAGNAGGSYVVAPNPASEIVTIFPMSESSALNAGNMAAASDAPAYEVTLYDNFGHPVHSGKNLKGKTTVDTRNLPNGIYNLRIGHGKDAINERIQVSH